MPRVILGVKLYSSEETAELLGTTKGTLYKYSQDGKIKATRISGKNYYSEENIKRFLQPEY